MFDRGIISLNIQEEAEVFLRTEIAKTSPSDRRVFEKFVTAALERSVDRGLSQRGSQFQNGGRHASNRHSPHSMARGACEEVG